MNPEKHWGPKARAVGKRAVDEVEDPKDDGGESRPSKRMAAEETTPK